MGAGDGGRGSADAGRVSGGAGRLSASGTRVPRVIPWHARWLIQPVNVAFW